MNRTKLYVLIACEESQAECLAFRALGHEAYSCDLQKARYNAAYHIQGDVRPYLYGLTTFVTQDGCQHQVSKWDLMICHPPCTYLCRCGAVHMVIGGVLQESRYSMMKDARDFFFECLGAKANYVAVENPIPMKRAQLPRSSCYIQPFWFGVKYSKKTLFWLRNLPHIMPTIIYDKPKCFVRSSRGKYRSRTFPQVAEAIAKQWSNCILEDIKKGLYA